MYWRPVQPGFQSLMKIIILALQKTLLEKMIKQVITECQKTKTKIIPATNQKESLHFY